MSGPSKKNIAGYDQWSGFYDSYPNPTVALDGVSFPALWAHLKNSRVLEVGCGTGRHTVKLAEQGNEVVGLDQSSGMLGMARERLAGKSCIQLIEADFLSYEGFAPGSFDAIVVSLVLEHFRDPQEFLLRAAGLLRAGGELFISEIHPHRTAQGTFAHFRDPERGEEIHLESYPHTEEEIKRAAEIVGLKVVKSVDVIGDERLSAMREKWRKYLGVPMVKMFVLGKS